MNFTATTHKNNFIISLISCIVSIATPNPNFNLNLTLTSGCLKLIMFFNCISHFQAMITMGAVTSISRIGKQTKYQVFK